MADIIRCEKEYKAAREKQTDPAAHLRYDKEELREALANDPDMLGVFGEDLYNHVFRNTGKNELVASGQVSQGDYEAAKRMRLENNSDPVGYALVTYSHADEVHQAIMQTGGKLVLDGQLVSLSQKNDQDHSTLDYVYFAKKMRNDGMLADISEELREARKGLRDFEADMDAQLPDKRRLKEFRALALEMLEGKSLQHGNSRRTNRELRELEDKLRKMQ